MFNLQNISPQQMVALIDMFEEAAKDPETDDETSVMCCRLCNRLAHMGMPFEAPLTIEEQKMISAFVSMIN